MPLPLEHRPIDALTPDPRNARTHSKKQIRQIADSIARFGFTNPVLIGDDGAIIAGHGRVAAAKLLGLADVPVVRLAHLSDAERRAYRLADNRLAQNARWDRDGLALELQALADLDFDVALTGFALPALIDDADAAPPAPDAGAAPVARPGDLCQLGPHRLLCADPRDPAAFTTLMGDARADLLFTAPPRLAAEGPPDAARTAYLRTTLGHAAAHLREGGLAFVGIDWRDMRALLDAEPFTRLRDLVVWTSAGGARAGFYRPRHALLFVFEQGSARMPARARGNVWEARADRPDAHADAHLGAHPGAMPVALIADAIRDATSPGGIVLDGFGGAGSTLIAADRTKRIARLIEPDPRACDAIVRRWQRHGGGRADPAQEVQR